MAGLEPRQAQLADARPAHDVDAQRHDIRRGEHHRDPEQDRKRAGQTKGHGHAEQRPYAARGQP